MSPSDESYGAFAYAYDQGLGDRFFMAVRPLLIDALEKYPTPKRTHLDLACGTGFAMELFAARGYRSTGVDASLPMLRLARKRSTRLVAADMRALPFSRTFARITCLYDSLNHMLDRNDLEAAFRSVRGVMDTDSLFLFDMNHPDIYPEVWGIAEPYVAEGADYRLAIATSYRAREKAAYARVTGWAVLPSGERVTIDESHKQRSYKEREIVDAMGKAGLAPVEVIDFDPFHEAGALEGDGVKLFFICRRT
jgi:SAM-dependent methyltransferase